MMIDFGFSEAFRVTLKWNADETGELPDGELAVSFPSDPWHAAIVHESYRLSKLTEFSASQAVGIYQKQVKAEKETAGRVIDPANPVQISGGILDAIELIERVEPVLEEFKGRIESYDQKATFGHQNAFEEMAKAGSNFSRTIIPRAKLFVHTYLWILWIQETLGQANRFGGLLQGRHNFNRFSERAFPFIAHPPLIVATIACSSMIEEVGAKYINAYVDGVDYKLDETSPRSVLKDLEKHHPKGSSFEIDKIEEEVIKSRNNISHYITTRDDVVEINRFKTFYNAVIEGVELVDVVLADLLYQPILNFHSNLEHLSLQ